MSEIRGELDCSLSLSMSFLMYIIHTYGMKTKDLTTTISSSGPPAPYFHKYENENVTTTAAAAWPTLRGVVSTIIGSKFTTLQLVYTHKRLFKAMPDAFITSLATCWFLFQLHSCFHC